MLFEGLPDRSSSSSSSPPRGEEEEEEEKEKEDEVDRVNKDKECRRQ